MHTRMDQQLLSRTIVGIYRSRKWARYGEVEKEARILGIGIGIGTANKPTLAFQCPFSYCRQFSYFTYLRMRHIYI